MTPSPRFYKIMLMVLPVGVVIGTIVFMVAYFHMAREEEREHSVIASYGLRMSDLEDMVAKFTDRIGLRDYRQEDGKRGLKQAASMIEGRLGPQNVGYNVEKGEGVASDGTIWRSLWVDLRGESKPHEVVIVAVSYAGAGQDADGNCLSTAMMLASSMARHAPAKTLRFVFLPLEQSSELQNQWLLERCLNEGEACVGVIGLKTMNKAPEVGGDDWEVETPRSQDQAWWLYLRGERELQPEQPAYVWVTTSVFSNHAWQDRRYDRLERTITLTAQIEDWLRRVSK
jgi:hypothetical protein